MADHSLPLLTSPYVDYTAYLKSRIDDALLALDPVSTTATNFPTKSMRFSSAAAKWQTYNGTSWVDSAASYAISISGNAATATKLATPVAINGTNFDGSSAITVNTANSLTLSSAGDGASAGITFNGSTARTLSYNSVGAPSVSGANATGTWNIGISGNAGSVTNGVYTTSFYTNPSWISTLAGSKITGTVPSATTVVDGVYTTGDQTITGSKTFTGTTTLKAVVETTVDMGSSLNLYPTNGTVQTKTIIANTAFVDSLSSGQSLILMLTNGNQYTVTWPTVTWVRTSGNIAPTLTASDTLIFWKVGTTLYASYVGSGA